ncbi:MAG: aminoacyl--tRNA ligase-related protein [Candidatus Falkowbacteria bacterium]
MRQSQFFSKISRELPKDEESYNAQTLIRAGFIDKIGAGIYVFLPLGLRVLNKINQIIRDEMVAIGGQELLLPALHPKEYWQATGRWESFDVLFRITGQDQKEYALGATHEEIITPVAKKYILSHKDLPKAVFQIQTKFRNEKRAKAGLIRGREFLMKDLYSFHANEEDLNLYYKQAQKAYFRVFERCGLLNQTYLTFASGGAFSKYSHEFQTVTSAGEDTIFICDDCQIAVNQEIIAEQNGCPGCGKAELREEKAVEVGNIFKLRTRFSDAIEFKYSTENGGLKPVEMGCYGIGPSRVMGTIVEVHHDERGIVWPKEVAPFRVHVISLNQPKVGQEIHDLLEEKGIEVLWDDREISAGEKFAESDLIGCPYRVVISEKTLAQGNKVEIKARNSASTEITSISRLVEIVK